MSYFHFTLGPVQAFVSQARRTRDFWAGSFLLSTLTAHAMNAVRKQNGRIIMPEVSDDKMLERVSQSSGRGPNIGTLPNCFEAAELSEHFDGKKIAKAVQDEWKRIADAVWTFDRLETAGVDKNLWETQIEGFWEIAWVIADAQETNVLAMRKNWRNHYPPEQSGDKCTMMGEWQELSGVSRPNREVQKNFWEGVRRGMGAGQMDLRDGERLCAIAYVKRRFVHVWEKLNPGWTLPTGVPSTSYMAAVHWLERLIISDPDPQAIQDLCAEAKKAKALSEKLTRITCLSSALNDHPAISGHLVDIDGPLFFENELRLLSESKHAKTGEMKPDEAKKIRVLRKKVVASAKKNDPAFPDAPSPFYAILVMDGDHLGKTKKAMGGDAIKLSEALAAFTGEVQVIVKKHGFLVYAGGDDVLALLPLENALDCALAVRNAYMTVFKNKAVLSGNYSISAAVIYAHMKLPLTLVLKDAQYLLKEVAKDECERDAIAVRIWKPGGEQVTWSMKWGLNGAKVNKLSELAKAFQADEKGEPGYASKPLFRIRERLLMLRGGTGFKSDEILKLLVAEYVTSGVLREKTAKQRQELAEKCVADLLPLCEKPEKPEKADKRYGAEAAMLLRFLAQKGVER